jgi:hypothetical protein
MVAIGDWLAPRRRCDFVNSTIDALVGFFPEADTAFESVMGDSLYAQSMLSAWRDETNRAQELGSQTGRLKASRASVSPSVIWPVGMKPFDS